jgi:hypothetical protein
MKKKVLSKGFVGVLFFFLVLAGSNASATDQWLVGQWIGTIFTGGDKLRSLEIVAIEGNTYKGKYGIPGEKMSEIPIQIIGDKIEFDTPAKARVVLSKIHETRMDGTLTVTSGKQMGVRYWKNTHKSPPEVVGDWEGRWEVGSNPATCRLCVEFADNTRASVYYAWNEWTDAYGKTHKAGWYRKDAKVEGNKIIFESGMLTFKFEIRDNGKQLIGKNDDGNNVTMLRKQL